MDVVRDRYQNLAAPGSGDNAMVTSTTRHLHDILCFLSWGTLADTLSPVVGGALIGSVITSWAGRDSCPMRGSVASDSVVTLALLGAGR